MAGKVAIASDAYDGLLAQNSSFAYPERSGWASFAYPERSGWASFAYPERSGWASFAYERATLQFAKQIANSLSHIGNF